MNVVLVSHRPAYIGAFVKTCFNLGLSADASEMLLEESQRRDLFTNIPAYRTGLESELKKVGAFSLLGRGADALIRGGLRGAGAIGKGLLGLRPMMKAPAGQVGPQVLPAAGKLADLQRLTTKMRLPVLGAGAGAGAIAGGKSIWDKWQENSGLADLQRLAIPNYADEAVGAAKTPGLSGSGGTGSPFAFMDSMNRGGMSGGTWGGARTSASAAPGASSPNAPTSMIESLKKQLANVTKQHGDLEAQYRAGQASSDPQQMISGMQARHAMTALDAQRGSLKRQLESLVSGVRNDQSRMHSSAASAISAADKLTPDYLQRLQKSIRLNEGGGSFLDRLITSPEKARGQAEEYAAMLQKIQDVRRRAQKANNTTLIP